LSNIGYLLPSTHISACLKGAITGWTDDTFAYSKRFNGNDFPSYCLVVVIGGAGPMKRNFGSAFLLSAYNYHCAANT
jgi:hypothetical protein